MLSVSRTRQILNLAVPIVLAGLATNLMTLVDTAMVGQLGSSALAGIGISGQFFVLLLGLQIGTAAGVQAIVARRVGEQLTHTTGRILNGGIVLAAALGGGLMIAGYLVLPNLMPLLNADPDVVDSGVDYFLTRLPSVLFIGINLAFRAYWVGVSLAKWAMTSILVLSISNVVFNYLLIFGNFGFPQLGVAGAGLGSSLATIAGLLVNVGLAFTFAKRNGFLQGLPAHRELIGLWRLSYPEGLRQFVLSLGVIAFYLLVGLVGTQELAAFHVVITISMLVYLPIMGFGQAATTLVSAALGARQIADAKRWGWEVANLGFIALLLSSLAIVLLPEPSIKLFINEPTVIAMAVVPLQIGIVAHVIEGHSRILGAALVGAGATRLVLWVSSALMWLLFLPVLALCVSHDANLTDVFSLFFAYAALNVAVFAALWHWGAWQNQWQRIEAG